jgi:hypothetical protein
MDKMTSDLPHTTHLPVNCFLNHIVTFVTRTFLEKILSSCIENGQ